MLPQPLEINLERSTLSALRSPLYTLRFSRGEKKVLRRKKLIPVSQWTEKHRIVPGDSPIPGKWKNATTPYLSGIMDASFFPSVQEIIVCAPPQTGKSECVNNCVGYAIDRMPGNVLYVYPDELTAKENCNDRIQPMINDSPRLKTYLTGYEDDASSLKIKLQHMKIYMGWATSASRLGNKPLPYAVLDEEDKYPAIANKREAAPVDLAKKRTRNFPYKRKIWRVSTPTVESGSIWKALTQEAEVVFVYWVQCPRCEVLQLMVFSQIKWPADKRDPRAVETQKLAWYECEHCQSRWNDADRNQAVKNGAWFSRSPTPRLPLLEYLQTYRPRSIGFHMRVWISPFVSMSESAAAFLWGLQDINKFKDFKNAHEAEPWKIIVKERSETALLPLRDDRPRGVVPGGNQVAALTGGIDTQDNGFYFEIRAWSWGLRKDSWQVREGFLLTFEDLARVLWEDEYFDADGNQYIVRLAVQDAMGHKTSEVYDFCRLHRGRIFPSKGERVMNQPFAYTQIEFYPGSKKPIKGGLKLIRVNTQFFKNELSNRLEIAPADPGAWRYHSETTDDWIHQMTMESIDESGFWINPTQAPNHAWDCSVLSLAAQDVLGVKFWKKIGDQGSGIRGQGPGLRRSRRIISKGLTAEDLRA